jgi:hypothetical protein
LIENPGAPLSNLVRKLVAEARDVLNRDLVEQNRDGIQVRGKWLSSYPRRFKWNGPATRERIQDDKVISVRWFPRIGDRSRHREEIAIRAMIPVREVSNELQQSVLQHPRLRKVELPSSSTRAECRQLASSFGLKGRGAFGVGRIGPEGRKNHRATGS